VIDSSMTLDAILDNPGCDQLRDSRSREKRGDSLGIAVAIDVTRRRIDAAFDADRRVKVKWKIRQG
jgi:hypothetical protein